MNKNIRLLFILSVFNYIVVFPLLAIVLFFSFLIAQSSSTISGNAIIIETIFKYVWVVAIIGTIILMTIESKFVSKRWHLSIFKSALFTLASYLIVPLVIIIFGYGVLFLLAAGSITLQ